MTGHKGAHSQGQRIGVAQELFIEDKEEVQNTIESLDGEVGLWVCRGSGSDSGAAACPRHGKMQKVPLCS